MMYDGNNWIVDIALKKFLDTVNQDRLCCSQLLLHIYCLFQFVLLYFHVIASKLEFSWQILLEKFFPFFQLFYWFYLIQVLKIDYKSEKNREKMKDRTLYDCINGFIDPIIVSMPMG